jgi:hexulose-6-phosphate isomerase
MPGSEASLPARPRAEAPVHAAINAWTFPDATSVSQQIDRATEAGFDGIELVVETDGPLTFETPDATLKEAAAHAAARGVRIDGLATARFWDVNYGSDDAGERQAACDLTRRLLDQAAACGAGSILVVPAVVGQAEEPVPRIAYADALYRTSEALDTLRHEAEARAVTIAIENVWNRFLLSPPEAADLVDRVNSPYVGFYLDVGNTLVHGYPQDWIHTLAHRIRRVHAKDYDLTRPGRAGFCPLGEGSVDWPVVVTALRGVGYDGPLTYEGPGDPDDIRRRMQRILDTPPRAAEETPS